MARRTGDETRTLLLRVGVQMLLERGVSAGVQHIRLQEVLRRAGMTSGAAYRLWADQDEYQRDLAVAMVRLRLGGPADYLHTAADALIASGADSDEIIKVAADAHVRAAAVDVTNRDEALDAQQFRIALALRTAAETWPQLKEASHRRHRESIAAFAEFYASLMEAYGLRMRTPLTIEDFAEAMAAMGEGFGVRALEGIPHPTYQVEETDEIPPGSWSLFALGVRALVNEFMTPADAVATPIPVWLPRSSRTDDAGPMTAETTEPTSADGSPGAE
ncbi:MAG: hypothetical protein QM622_02600 [Microbacterium sp.]